LFNFLLLSFKQSRRIRVQKLFFLRFQLALKSVLYICKMKRFTTWLLNISLVLVIAGMFSHEFFPHHHHDITGNVQECCESHNNNDSEKHNESPCTILSNIHFENLKPELQVFSQELKHNHTHAFIAECTSCNSLAFISTLTITRVFVPESVFSEIDFYNSFSYRGPPLA
jgi:hypothetical protein